MTDNKKAKRLSKEEKDSITIYKIVELDDLNKEAEEMQDPEKAAEIIKRYEDVIKMKHQGYHQGQVFKRFKELKSLVSSSVIRNSQKYHHF